MKQVPRSPAPRSRGPLILDLVDREVVEVVVHLAAALVKDPAGKS